MMTEKDMVNDYLNSLKSSLTGYASAISESSNPELRKTFQQMRDAADEERQQRIAQYATQKGYYQPAAQAQPNQVQQVYSQLQGGGQQQQGQQGMQSGQGMRM